jgi:hypothetical protein
LTLYEPSDSEKSRIESLKIEVSKIGINHARKALSSRLETVSNSTELAKVTAETSFYLAKLSITEMPVRNKPISSNFKRVRDGYQKKVKSILRSLYERFRG